MLPWSMPREGGGPAWRLQGKGEAVLPVGLQGNRVQGRQPEAWASASTELPRAAAAAWCLVLTSPVSPAGTEKRSCPCRGWF